MRHNTVIPNNGREMAQRFQLALKLFQGGHVFVVLLNLVSGQKRPGHRTGQIVVERVIPAIVRGGVLPGEDQVVVRAGRRQAWLLGPEPAAVSREVET